MTLLQRPRSQTDSSTLYVSAYLLVTSASTVARAVCTRHFGTFRATSRRPRHKQLALEYVEQHLSTRTARVCGLGHVLFECGFMQF